MVRLSCQLWPHVLHVTQPLSPCHALTTCTVLQPRHLPYPRWIQMILRPRPFPKQVLHTLSHRCQRTTIIEQYTLRFVSSYLQRDRVTLRRFECVYRSAFFPVVIHSLCLPCAVEDSCDSTAEIFIWNGATSLDTSKYRPWKEFLVSSTSFPLHRDYLHVHISGRRATISESAMRCRGYR